MADTINSLVEKVSSYNLFNHLLTGVVFLAGLGHIAAVDPFTWTAVKLIFLAYFVGMVLSRIGSLIVEPAARKTHFVEYAAYSDYVTAEKSDSKLAALLEANNTYRTFAAVFGALVLVKAFILLEAKYAILKAYVEWAWPVGLVLLFLFSYRKQTKHIANRVSACPETQGRDHPEQKEKRETVHRAQHNR